MALLTSEAFYAQTNKYEKVALDCTIKIFKSKDIDFNKEMWEYEKYLIDKGYIKNSSGESYISFFEKVLSINAIPATRKENLFNKLSGFNFNEFCFEREMLSFKRDSKELEASKFYHFIIKVNKIPDSKKYFSSLANAVLETFDSKDFENSLIKNVLLMNIALGANDSGHETFEKLKSIDW